MPGKHRKGTNDADGNGKKGGSLPEDAEVVEPAAAEVAEEPAAAEEPAKETKAKPRDLGKEIDDLKDLLRRNGMTV